MLTACFSCHISPAGSPVFPSSAYCAACQPLDARKKLDWREYNKHDCGACHRRFATVTDFESHLSYQGDWEQLGCQDPAVAGLELAAGLETASGGIWGTPEGNAFRALLPARLAEVNARIAAAAATQ